MFGYYKRYTWIFWHTIGRVKNYICIVSFNFYNRPSYEDYTILNLILNFQNCEVIGSKLQTEKGMCFDYNTEYFLVLLLWASGFKQRWFWIQRTLGNIWRNIWLSYLEKCNWNKVCWGKRYSLTKLKCTGHPLTQGITYHNVNSGEVEKHCSLNKHFSQHQCMCE